VQPTRFMYLACFWLIYSVECNGTTAVLARKCAVCSAGGVCSAVRVSLNSAEVGRLLGLGVWDGLQGLPASCWSAVVEGSGMVVVIVF
jgi:hypothetical protein